MRTTMKKLSLMLAVFAATVGFAGDSAPFLLDTAEGTRIATEGEAIPVAYSPRWGNAASCTVTTAGAPSLRTDEGVIIWTPQGTGAHTLTHTAGDLTYTAQFAVLGDEVAVHAGALGTSGTWGTGKTHLVTSPLTIPSGVALAIEPGAVVKFMPGTGITVARGGSCTARGVIFTHVNDDTVGAIRCTTARTPSLRRAITLLRATSSTTTPPNTATCRRRRCRATYPTIRACAATARTS